MRRRKETVPHLSASGALYEDDEDANASGPGPFITLIYIFIIMGLP